MFKALMKSQRDTPHPSPLHTTLPYSEVFDSCTKHLCITRCSALPAPKHGHYRTVSNAYSI